MQDGTRTEVGTCITLFLNEDCLQFCNEYKATEVIKKYCSFMPVEIYVSRANTPETQMCIRDSSVAAPAIEFQKEGQVFGIGCKIFTIAGPVILYGIFVSWVLGLIGWIGSLL